MVICIEHRAPFYYYLCHTLTTQHAKCSIKPLNHCLDTYLPGKFQLPTITHKVCKVKSKLNRNEQNNKSIESSQRNQSSMVVLGIDKQKTKRKTPKTYEVLFLIHITYCLK